MTGMPERIWANEIYDPDWRRIPDSVWDRDPWAGAAEYIRADIVAEKDAEIEAARELLCILHRDGGHHIANVGFVQACRDAMGGYWERCLSDDAKDAKIERLKAENLNLTVKVSDLGLLHHSDRKEIERLKQVNDNAVARIAFLGMALGQAVQLANIRVDLRPKAGDEEGEGTEYVYCDTCGTPFMSTLAAYLRERVASGDNRPPDSGVQSGVQHPEEGGKSA